MSGLDWPASNWTETSDSYYFAEFMSEFLDLGNDDYTQAMRHYMQALIACSDGFSKPLPKNVVDDSVSWFGLRTMPANWSVSGKLLFIPIFLRVDDQRYDEVLLEAWLSHARGDSEPISERIWRSVQDRAESIRRSANERRGRRLLRIRLGQQSLRIPNL